jgi:hypothetical protein
MRNLVSLVHVYVRTHDYHLLKLFCYRLDHLDVVTQVLHDTLELL